MPCHHSPNHHVTLLFLTLFPKIYYLYSFLVCYYSGEVCSVDIGSSLSVGQVVWGPPTKGSHQYLVFVGWPLSNRKFGMKYCTNRPCALYAVKAPLFGLKIKENATNNVSLINLSEATSSAFLPRFT